MAIEWLSRPNVGDLSRVDRMAEVAQLPPGPGRMGHRGGKLTGLDMSQPTGTVTFIFTDIEGSTRLVRELGDAYADVLESHHSLLRKTFGEHDGHEFASEGDALFFTFAKASDAVAAALDAQRGLARQSWPTGAEVRVRIGLHTGEVQFRDGAYVGLALHQAARICAAANGGQVLLSEATRHIIGDRLPAGASVGDLGEHHLKDLAQAQRLFQLRHSDLRDDFPPLRTLDTLPNNLPLQLTSFIGRDAEMAEVRRLLEASKLVTLTGAGGAGKTRLGLQVAGDVLDEFNDGVWLVELASVTDPALVASSAAGVLGIREEAGRPLAGTLTQALRDRQLLLILDNCEHLTAACAELANDLLRGAPQLQILATSREPLAIAGETAWRVPSLGLPDPAGAEALSSLLQCEAVRLFIERGHAARGDFEINEGNAPAIAQICHRLDGIPLALELAAARLRLLSPDQIAERLDDRFRLLTGGSRTALARQQTLRAAVDWSHDLLSEPERLLLRRLAVFVGGFDLEAAEAICSQRGLESYEILELLGQLVDKSLVAAEERDGSTRYRMLETIRQYAREKLADSDEVAAIRTAHRDYFLVCAERQDHIGPYGDQTPERFERLSRDYDNLTAAIEWSLGARSPADEALRLTNALAPFFSHRGLWAEGHRWIEQAMTLADPDSLDLRRAGFTHLAWLSGDADKDREYIAQALALARQLDDHTVIARHLTWQSWSAYRRYDMGTYTRLLDEALAEARLGDPDDIANREALASALLGQVWAAQWVGDRERALTLLKECLAIRRAMDAPFAVAWTLDQLASVVWGFGRLDEAERYLREAIELTTASGHSRERAGSQVSLAQLQRQRGDLETARTICLEALAVYRDLDQAVGKVYALRELARIDIELGDLTAAEAWAEEAMPVADQLSSAYVTVIVALQGKIALAKGDRERAKRLLEQAESAERGHRRLVELGGVLLELSRIALDEGYIAEAYQKCSEALACYALVLSYPDSVAASLELLGAIAVAEGELGTAARTLGCAEALRERTRRPVPASKRPRLDAAAASIVSRLGEAEAKRAWDEGRNTDPRVHEAPAIEEIARRAAGDGRRAFALTGFARAAGMFDEVGEASGAARCLADCARLMADAGASERAVRLLAIVDSHGSDVDAGFMSELRVECPDDFDRAWSEGATMTVSEAARDVIADPVGEALIMAEPSIGESVPVVRSNVFRREGDYWTVAFRGRVARMRDTKGLAYLAVLLAAPGREFHVADLYGAKASSSLDREKLEAQEGHAGVVLDAQARDEYRRRLTDLGDEVAEATTFGDDVRASRAQDEIDALTGVLAGAYGLGGRVRTLGDPVERMRKAVSNRIRDAISRIEKEDDELARHLSMAVRTGTYCSYEPEQRTDWIF